MYADAAVSAVTKNAACLPVAYKSYLHTLVPAPLSPRTRSDDLGMTKVALRLAHCAPRHDLFAALRPAWAHLAYVGPTPANCICIANPNGAQIIRQTALQRPRSACAKHWSGNRCSSAVWARCCGLRSGLVWSAPQAQPKPGQLRWRPSPGVHHGRPRLRRKLSFGGRRGRCGGGGLTFKRMVSLALRC